MTPAPTCHFVKPEAWAAANGYGVKAVREFLHREDDPIPHVRKGTDYLIDDELAVEWVRSHFGVGIDSSSLQRPGRGVLPLPPGRTAGRVA